jgi:starvation-inducible DNA-binding protein
MNKASNQINSTVTILKQLLADEFVLYTKTRKAHWNVYGPNFYSLHKFFEMGYEELDQIVDSVAERIRSLGDFATGTLEEFKATTVLTENPGSHELAPKLIKQLLTDHETIISFLNENIP